MDWNGTAAQVTINKYKWHNGVYFCDVCCAYRFSVVDIYLVIRPTCLHRNVQLWIHQLLICCDYHVSQRQGERRHKSTDTTSNSSYAIGPRQQQSEREYSEQSSTSSGNKSRNCLKCLIKLSPKLTACSYYQNSVDLINKQQKNQGYSSKNQNNPFYQKCRLHLTGVSVHAPPDNVLQHHHRSCVHDNSNCAEKQFDVCRVLKELGVGYLIAAPKTPAIKRPGRPLWSPNNSKVQKGQSWSFFLTFFDWTGSHVWKLAYMRSPT